MKNSEETFPLYPLVRFSRLGDAFSKILEVKRSPAEVSNCSKKTRTEKKIKTSKELGSTFLHVRAKNFTKRDASAKEGVPSCFILSTFCIFQEYLRVIGLNNSVMTAKGFL